VGVERLQALVLARHLEGVLVGVARAPVFAGGTVSYDRDSASEWSMEWRGRSRGRGKSRDLSLL
jgi:hypothetical protein